MEERDEVLEDDAILAGQKQAEKLQRILNPRLLVILFQVADLSDL